MKSFKRKKSIQFGRCLKSHFLRRTLDFNSSALTETTFRIPPAPPLPSSFDDQKSFETLKSTDFSQAIQTSPSSLTPTTPKNRRRTPLTPEILALTKLRRPEHIKSSIAQRIEELKIASSSSTTQQRQENIKSTDLVVTCDLQNTPQERLWLKEQIQNSTPMKFFNTPQYLQLNDRIFTVRSFEFLDQHQIRFHTVEQTTFIPQCLKQLNILTILIIIFLRLVENALTNLSIPGIPILLNLIYVLVLITIAILLLLNQKQ